MVAMGLCLIDNLQFEDLIPVCEAQQRWSFLFIVAPLRIRYGTGSPATPLAVF
jgi:kynurenine formamidase